MSTAAQSSPDMLPAADRATDARARIAGYDQEALLHALAILDFNPAELAAQLSISPFALLGWFESEEVQSQIARYRAFEHRMLELRAFKTRRLTIAHLEHVLETTEDLIEKRRTAAALLRVIGGTDLRDVRKAGGTDLRDVKETSAANPNGRTSTNRTAARAKHTSARSTSGEPCSASDHAPPDPHARSTSREAPASLSEPLLSEPGSASDHGGDTPNVRTSAPTEPGSACDDGTPAPCASSVSPGAPAQASPSQPPTANNRDAHTCDRDSDAPTVVQIRAPQEGNHAPKSQTDLPAPKPHQLE